MDRVRYTFDNNGNLLATGLLTNTFDAANRLIETTRARTTLQPHYDGLGNQVGQTVGLSTTTFALDVQGLPEVIYTSAGNAYLHLPGVIVAENAAGERRFLLPDGLGSVRQATDETWAVVAYHAFDPYGNPILNSSFLISNYGFTGEWWEAEVGLLYLRARWYAPETGSFVSRDPVAGEPAYLYVKGNPINTVDPTGLCAELYDQKCWNIYNQIITLCLECAEMKWYTSTDGTVTSLHERDSRYLQTVLDHVQAGWRPGLPFSGQISVIINLEASKYGIPWQRKLKSGWIRNC